MKIAEIYQSVQGEGELTGTDSVFVRASGCNLRCIWCDTPYSSWEPTGIDRSVTDIAAEVQGFEVRHIVVTGGEPMLFSELIPLCQALREHGCHITIETAGTLYLPVECDLMSVSPKTANSAPPAEQFPKWNARHEKHRHAPDVIRRLIRDFKHQFKFVIESPQDVKEVATYCDSFPELQRDRVMLMPQARTVGEHQRIEEWLTEAASRYGMKYCPRRQIEWFGCEPGT